MVALQNILFSFSPFRLYTIDAGQASETLLRECWEFRLSMIDLRPEVSRETDWNAFRSYFEPGVELLTLRTRAGALRGIFAWSVRNIDDNGSKHPIVDAEYGFVHPSTRGSIAVPAVIFHVWFAAMRATRSSTIHLLGSGYPSGVLSFGRVVNRLVSLSDADIAPWERKAIETYCAENDCEDPARGILRMRTKPIETNRIPRTEINRQRLAWFESQVPHWREGFGLVYVVRFNPFVILRSWFRATSYSQRSNP